MSLAVLYSCALSGMQAPIVCVEVHLSAGLPNFTIVGLPDTGVRESKERVRSAIDSGGWDFPPGRFTVNLSPTALPKESGRFDLPIAIGVLMATGQVVLSEQQQANLENMYFMAELSLTGALISIQAPLIIALSIYKQNPKAILILPEEDAKIAARVEGLTVIGAKTLNDVADYLSGRLELDKSYYQQPEPRYQDKPLCLSDIRGQPYACHVLEIAASGGHGLILSGSPGVGKSMLAHRLPTLLPSLTMAQQLDLIAIYSLVHSLEPPDPQLPPFRAPHHSCSMVALVGGGAAALPGEISLANHGVLFLDELPEFDRKALEALREPLDTGEIHISRAKRSQSYPARFQLVAAYNPCPCGYLGHATKLCRCTPEKVERYQSKLSGPLLERIDIHLQVQAIKKDWLTAETAETSARVRERVVDCRERQYQRQGGLNAYLSNAQIEEFCRLDKASQHLLTQAMNKFSWSARVNQRVLKVARTIADMAGHSSIEKEDLTQAIMCRCEH
ncbi:Fis family transcriptional regulator [Pelistega indica]|uniref:Fis family transcriptional regulator n=1 Tax=Pelistega indica TaxID=1414851 RepID=V8FS40_9BURK|nr:MULTISPECIES: YifB family Mg chelatase-like AAA ATPase [Pelistega]ETD66711.1 Fis family transcriptional regulator [Pelistega indica]